MKLLNVLTTGEKRFQAAFENLANLSIATEDNADGKAVIECEHVIYAKLINVAQLEKATSKTHQEQWNMYIPKTEDNAAQGSIRIRKIVEGEKIEYHLTTKVKKGEDKLEVSVPTTEDNFVQFKFLSPDGLIKDRFCFPVENSELVWEIDMFLKEDGSYHEWCKIDLEVKDRSQELPPLPIEFADVILPKGFGREQPDEEAEATIAKLYEECFRTKNIYTNKA
jgi:hypothetical protein